LARADPFIELTLQLLLGICRQTDFDRLPARHFRQLSELVLQISSRDVVPETVFECEHIHMFFLDPDNFGVRQLDHDFVVAHIDRHVLSQIKARFGEKGSAQLHPLGAAGPGVGELAFHFQLARESCELGGGRSRFADDRLIIDGNSRLQMRDVDERRAQILAQTLQLVCSLTNGARWPGFETPKYEEPCADQNQHDKGQRDRPRYFC
jgi:hypothetical protein